MKGIPCSGCCTGSNGWNHTNTKKKEPSPTGIIPDRDPAEYFHGREDVLRDFDKLLRDSEQRTWGTTLIIQGPPGIGKSALLHECKKHARAAKWDAFDIGVGSLWDPQKLLHSLDLGNKYEVTEKSTQFGVKDVVGRGHKSTRLPRTVLSILKDGSQPLLLILDEAQRLSGDGGPPEDQGDSVGNVLDSIHNGKLGRPAVLLVGGLVGTRSALGKFGISRFAKGAVVDMEPLKNEEERALIHDWLSKEGGAKGDTTAWVDAIAQETHQWPQHVMSYVYPARDLLRNHNGIMTEEGLSTVLEAGRVARVDYYRGRVSDFEGDEIICLSEAITDIGSGMPFEKEQVMSPLSEKYGVDGAKKIFQKFLKKGVISIHGYLYSVPIPSMHDWMKAELERTRKELERAMRGTQEKEFQSKTVHTR